MTDWMSDWKYIYQHKPIFFLMTKAAFWTKAQSLVLFSLGGQYHSLGHPTLHLCCHCACLFYWPSINGIIKFIEPYPTCYGVVNPFATTAFSQLTCACFIQNGKSNHWRFFLLVNCNFEFFKMRFMIKNW